MLPLRSLENTGSNTRSNLDLGFVLNADVVLKQGIGAVEFNEAVAIGTGFCAPVSGSMKAKRRMVKVPITPCGPTSTQSFISTKQSPQTPRGGDIQLSCTWGI